MKSKKSQNSNPFKMVIPLWGAAMLITAAIYRFLCTAHLSEWIVRKLMLVMLFFLGAHVFVYYFFQSEDTGMLRKIGSVTGIVMLEIAAFL